MKLSSILISFKIVYLLLISLYISSCSHERILEGTDFQKVMKAHKGLCLTGEGKGRIKFARNKYVFSYEIASQKNIVQGQFFFPFQDPISFKYKGKKLTGSIVDLIAKEAGRNSNTQKFSQSLLSFLSELVELSKRPSVEKHLKKCFYGSTTGLIKGRCEGGPVYLFSLAKDSFELKKKEKEYSLNIEFRNLNSDNHYTRLHAELRDSYQRSPMEMDMIISSCSVSG